MGEGFAYRIWRLYGSSNALWYSLMGVPGEAREAFVREYWRRGLR